MPIKTSRRSARSGFMTGLLVIAINITATPVAVADSTSFRDPRGDAPARYDITTVGIANAAERLTARVRVLDLVARGTQIFGVGISSPDGSRYYVLHVVRRPSGATTAELTGFSSGAEPVACRISRSWSPQTDVIRVAVPRSCIKTRGALRTSVFIGAGDGSAGDPADFTKTIRVGQS